MTRHPLALLAATGLVIAWAWSCGSAAAQSVTVSAGNDQVQVEAGTDNAADQPSAADQAGVTDAQKRDARREASRTCLRNTGSRITAAQNLRAEKSGKAQQCSNGSGRVYTAEDLSRSGHIDINAALRSLDPSLR